MSREQTATVLVASEDDATRVFLADNLQADGYDVVRAHDAESAIAQLRTHYPDLLIADLNGQTLGLVDVVRAAHGAIGEVNPAVPVLALTSRPDELNIVRGLDHGCDDVMGKPFSYPELRARTAAILRRLDRKRTGPTRVTIGALEIHHDSRRVLVHGREVALSRREFDLLRMLASNPTRVFTKEELLRSIWGASTHTRTLDSHAVRLRNKLAADGDHFVLNAWGVGYRLVDALPSEAVAA